MTRGAAGLTSTDELLVLRQVHPWYTFRMHSEHFLPRNSPYIRCQLASGTVDCNTLDHDSGGACIQYSLVELPRTIYRQQRKHKSAGSQVRVETIQVSCVSCWTTRVRYASSYDQSLSATATVAMTLRLVKSIRNQMLHLIMRDPRTIIMAALWNRAGHYILPCGFYFFSLLFSSPNLSGRRLDVYHTFTHGVALVRI